MRHTWRVLGVVQCAVALMLSQAVLAVGAPAAGDQHQRVSSPPAVSDHGGLDPGVLAAMHATVDAGATGMIVRLDAGSEAAARGVGHRLLRPPQPIGTNHEVRVRSITKSMVSTGA